MAEGTVVRDPPASLEAMAAVLVDEAAVDGVLQLLVSLARASVHGADEVSVSAVCSRDLDTIGASSDDDRQLDAHQYSTGEGPCVSAIADGQVHNVALATARARWPNFAPEALARVWIDPLHPPTGTGPHHRGPQPLLPLPDDVRGRGHRRRRGVRRARLGGARQRYGLLGGGGDQPPSRDGLDTARIIGRAQGVLMARQSCTSEEAFDMLRRASQRSNRKLREISEDIVSPLETSAQAAS